MKKSLIALAVLASVAGVAQAQSSVQLYGIVDLWFGSSKNHPSLNVGDPAGKSRTQLTSGGVSGSRWGMKGSEDLGGGLKANFLLESGFDADTGVATKPGFQRQAYVGLSGGFGEVKLGNVYTAYDDISGATTPVFDSTLSPTAVFASTGYNSNPKNNIYYASPVMGGLSGAVSYSLDENVAASTGVTAFHLKYEGGPVFAGFAYQTEGVAVGSDTKFTRINGSYDLGMAKLLGAYGKVDAAGTAGDFTEYTIGADIPLGSSMVASVGYANSNPKAAGAENNTAYSAAVAYVLSKRTTAYAGFVKTNKPSDIAAYAVGLKHTF